MSADANQEQTQTETTVTETPAAQPDTQGSVSPSPTQEPAAGSAQQAQGANSQHSNDFVPRWRLNEEIQKRRELEARFQTQPQQPPQQKPAEDGRPKQEDFQSYEEYLEAKAAHTARQITLLGTPAASAWTTVRFPSSARLNSSAHTR